MKDTEQKNREFKYNVFISYKHAEIDSAVAGYLQRALEHYRIPKEIREKTHKKKISRVFRDREELGVGSDLQQEIEEQIKNSEFLLVICSPAMKSSHWVSREIETFLKYRDRRNILLVLTEGEPGDAFPEALLDDSEPMAADFRGKSRREVLKKAKKELGRIMAPILHCSYDELVQRHKAYRMKQIALVSLLGALIALAFGVVTVLQNRKIMENYRAKQENQSRYLSRTASTLLEEGKREEAMLVALEALPDGSGDTSKPYVSDAYQVLEKCLYLYDNNGEITISPEKRWRTRRL